MSRRVWLGVLPLLACAAREVPADLPPPIYEPPRVLPWEAGEVSSEGDPFAAAAEGDWIGEGPGDEPGQDSDPPEAPDRQTEVPLDGTAGSAIN